MPDDAGNTGRRLVCGYHAWTYDLDGTLVGLPGAQDFQVDTALPRPAARALRAWGSLVFVNLDRDARTAARRPRRRRPRPARPDRGRRRRRPGAPRRPPIDRGRRQLEAHGRRQHRDLPRQHRPPDQRGRRPRPGGDRHLPAAPTATRGCSCTAATAKPLPIDLPALPGRQPAGELRHLLVPPVPQHEHRVRRVAGARLPDHELARSGRTAASTTCTSSPPRRPTDRTAALLAALVEANWAVLLEDLANLAAIQRSVASGGLDGDDARLPGAPHLPPARGARPAHRRRPGPAGAPRRARPRRTGSET